MPDANMRLFEAIQQEIEEKKTQRAKLLGGLEQTKSQLKQEFGHTSKEDAQEELDSLNKALAADAAKREQMIVKLRGMAPWEAL